MADYQETTVSGRKWRRCARIEISNPSAPATPMVTFSEADVALIDGKMTTLGTDSIHASFDPAAVIDLVDPDTLEPLGKTVTEAEIYLCLFSKYIAVAKARDALNAKRLQDEADAAARIAQAAAERLAAAQAAIAAAQTPAPTPAPTPVP